MLKAHKRTAQSRVEESEGLCTKKLRNIYGFPWMPKRSCGATKVGRTYYVGPLPESLVNEPIRMNVLTMQRLHSRNQVSHLFTTHSLLPSLRIPRAIEVM